jgi:hypothetical protein
MPIDSESDFMELDVEMDDSDEDDELEAGMKAN